MLLYCWGLIVENNLFSYAEVLAKLEIVEIRGENTRKKKKNSLRASLQKGVKCVLCSVSCRDGGDSPSKKAK